MNRCILPIVKNDIMFIIRIFKSTFMNGNLFYAVIFAFLLAVSPVSANTNKIPPGAPIFIGESDLDITSAVKDCHVIGWWPDGNVSGNAHKSLTLKQLNEANGKIAHFNVSPDIFAGYTGKWYCEDKEPRTLVLNVLEPTLSLKVWDLDHDTDVTGQSIPFATNITYRIDTNLNQALSYTNRTDLNPSDSFYTVQLTGPAGKRITNIYTGSVGGSGTQIILFDGNPFITTPTYFGNNLGSSWNRLSRDATGGLMYSSGVYTFTVSQNLNHMQELYHASGVTDLTGIATDSASVQILPEEALPATEVTTRVQPEVTDITPLISTAPPTTMAIIKSTPATTATQEKKTTYSPVSLPVVFASLGFAVFLLALRKH